MRGRGRIYPKIEFLNSDILVYFARNDVDEFGVRLNKIIRYRGRSIKNEIRKKIETNVGLPSNKRSGPGYECAV